MTGIYSSNTERRVTLQSLIMPEGIECIEYISRRKRVLLSSSDRHLGTYSPGHEDFWASYFKHG